MTTTSITPEKKAYAHRGEHSSGPRKQRQTARRRNEGETILKRELLISVGEFETRVALLEDGALVELSIERPETERMVGDIYKGRVSKVLPGMQSAFVEIGWEKAAFLHSSDMGHVMETGRRSDEPAGEDDQLDIVRKGRRVPIEKALKDKQELLVQVIKEPISTKGPRVTTDISIPGRYVVMTPDSSGVRVSKKIANWSESRRLRKIIEPLRPEGFGLICRTESEGKEEKDFIPDIKRSLRMWTQLKKKADSTEAPALIHKEEEMTLSIVRDMLSSSVDKIRVDDRREYRRIAAYIRQVSPDMRGRLELHKGKTSLFDEFDIERDIEKMFERQIWMKKGSYLVIDQTEAMITIDVNTGRFVGTKDQEETIFRTNIEAAKEIARALRLRDMGGLIVCDFIDMYNRDNRRKLSEAFKRELDKDRAKKAISPVSDFGLIELTRQRVRPSLMQTFSETCDCCNGLGRVLSKETMSAKIDRWFIRAQRDNRYHNFHLVVNPTLADALVGEGSESVKTGNRLRKIMKMQKIKVNLVRDTSMSLQRFKVYETDKNAEITEAYQ
jgi:ribonuclease G